MSADTLLNLLMSGGKGLKCEALKNIVSLFH